MIETKQRQFREQLEELARRLRGDIGSLEDQARMGLGGGAGGDLSNTPMHLGDLGTEQYLQELNSTLLENETYLRREVQAALERCDRGEFGTCERCGAEIIEDRLEVLPYTRYCTACAAEVQAGQDVNLNDGRPEGGLGDFERRHGTGAGTESERADQEVAFTRQRPNVGDEMEDVHAAGSAGGGTAIGGLAGTNIGEGDPDDGDLENAMGSGNFDVAIEEDDEETTAYSGPGGGAVGGTPAEKRAIGGRTGGGIAPQPAPGESPTGQ